MSGLAGLRPRKAVAAIRPSGPRMLCRVRFQDAGGYRSEHVSFSPAQDVLLREVVQDRPVIEVPMASHGWALSLDADGTGLLARMPGVVRRLDLTDGLSSGVGMTQRRLLTVAHGMAWVFADGQDHLLGVHVGEDGRLVLERTIWTQGHRLTRGVISSDGEGLLGWDDRNRVLAAFDLRDGRRLATLAVETADMRMRAV